MPFKPQPKQQVFYLDKNKISFGNIVMMLDRKEESIYHLNTGYNIPEHLLFESIEALLDNLIEQYEQSLKPKNNNAS